MQRIGLEYELEGLAEHWQELEAPKGWKITPDGTLRGNGAEFLTRGPINITKGSTYLKRLIKMLDGGYEISHRCSMHMHIDFNGLKGWQRIAGLALLVAFENEFFKFAPDRANNHFCTRQLRSPAFYQSLYIMANAYDWANEVPVETVPLLRMPKYRSVNTKYTAVNVLPMKRDGIGTTELRHFSPIMDTDQLDDLCSVVTHIMQAVRAMPSKRWPDVRRHMENFREEATIRDESIPSHIDWTIQVIDSFHATKAKPGYDDRIEGPVKNAVEEMLARRRKLEAAVINDPDLLEW